MQGKTLTKSKLLLLLLLTISHLTQNIPTVSEHQVFLVDTAIHPMIQVSLRRVLFVPAPETKVSNATMAVGMLATVPGNLRRSERISSRAPSVEPCARGGKPRGRSAAQSGASSGESSGCASLHHIFELASIIFKSSRNNLDTETNVVAIITRVMQVTTGDSPEPDDLNAYRTLDPSHGGSPTNNNDTFTAGEGQAPFHG